MTRIRSLLLVLAVTGVTGLLSATPARAMKAGAAITAAGSHCTVDVFVENGRAAVMIICGTFPNQTVIFCKGDDDCYISTALGQSVPTSQKPGLGIKVTEAQTIPVKRPKESVSSYTKRVTFAKLTSDDALVKKALAPRALLEKTSKVK